MLECACGCPLSCKLFCKLALARLVGTHGRTNGGSNHGRCGQPEAGTTWCARIAVDLHRAGGTLTGPQHRLAAGSTSRTCGLDARQHGPRRMLRFASVWRETGLRGGHQPWAVRRHAAVGREQPLSGTPGLASDPVERRGPCARGLARLPRDEAATRRRRRHPRGATDA